MSNDVIITAIICITIIIIVAIATAKDMTEGKK